MFRSKAAFAALFVLLTSSLPAAEQVKFRTDADGPVLANAPKPAKGKDTSPQWYQLVDGQFPPQGSAHAVSGELMLVDHLDRHFQIRNDRNDSQDRGNWDLPLDATMLPYGSIYFQGAPAALQDIPLGTHLHGLFYLKDPDDKSPDLPGAYNNRHTADGDFRRCLRIEDDFSFDARQKELWRIDSVDLTAMKLTVTLEQDGKATGVAKIFDVLSSTRIMKDKGFGDLTSLQPGQKILMNFTWVTLYGPGRITDIWIDDASRQLATARQLECHRTHIRDRGLPGWVTAVDDAAEVVTLTFFDGVDPGLFDELSITDGKKATWPLTKDAADSTAPKGSLAVAMPNLMSYDPLNDRKGATILSIEKIPTEPGNSGVQIKIKMDMLLEGFRPRRIIRFYPSAWKVNALPLEERYESRE